jgi:hypothetical protein
VELIQQTTSVQGQPVYKVTVFDKLTTVAGQPSVIGHQLLDANGKEICSARVTNAPPDKNTGAVVPRTVTLAWPSQKIEMTMKLDDVRVNGLAAGQQLAVFQRPQLRSVRDIDLAHLPEDLVHPTGGQVQRVRGSMR